MMKKLLILILLIFSKACFSQGNGYFNDIDKALKNPNSVIILDLEKQKIKQIPSSIFHFINLEKLILKRNYIKVVPKEICLLTKLHYLDISSNYISELPQQMHSLKLDTLIMWDNRVREFDEEFKVMGTTLKYLDLRAIQMNKKEQTEIRKLFPHAQIRFGHPCNCNR